MGERPLSTASDELVVGLDASPRSSDPRLVGFDALSQYAEELLYLPLVSFSPEGDTQWVVAKEITPLGPTKWRVCLRDGIGFAGGGTLTSADVVGTYRQILEGTTPPSPRKGAFAGVKVEATGSHEVIFTLGAPDASFVANLVVGILPQRVLGAPRGELQGLGAESGPYVLELAGEREWVLAKNPRFSADVVGWKASQLRRIRLRPFADSGTRFAALVKGEIDLVQNALDPDKISQIWKRHSHFLSVLTRSSLRTVYLAFQCKDPVFSDVRVRKAIAHAIHRDEILRYTLQGLADPATGMFPPGWKYHDDRLQDVPYDPALAERLLAEAGLRPNSEGVRLSAAMQVPAQRERVAVAKAVASDLRKVGIDLTIETMDSALLNRQLQSGSVRLWIAPWVGFKDPDHLRFVFHSREVPPDGGNRGQYANPAVDRLLEAGRLTTESGSRKRLYDDAQELLAKDFPYVYLWHPYGTAVIRKGIRGFTLYADGRYRSLTEVEKSL